MMYNSLTFIEQDIREMIESNLERTGILYRLHTRIKTNTSINEKIIRKGYHQNGKLIQDVIGVRVMTYFSEDVDILVDYFSSVFNIVCMEYDNPDIDTFSPVRVNLVCRMQETQFKEFHAWKNRSNHLFKYVDSTFEIQIRTVFSEGWHEIEHHMRYKCQAEWDKMENESRLLNGIYATLETSDRTMVRLFDDIAYKHYKHKNWTGMIRNKFRLKFDLEPLSPAICALFNEDNQLAKSFYKINRKDIIYELIKNDLWMNITFSNMVYLCNYLFIRNDDIFELTPVPLINQFEDVFQAEALYNVLYIRQEENRKQIQRG